MYLLCLHFGLRVFFNISRLLEGGPLDIFLGAPKVFFADAHSIGIHKYRSLVSQSHARTSLNTFNQVPPGGSPYPCSCLNHENLCNGSPIWVLDRKWCLMVRRRVLVGENLARKRRFWRFWAACDVITAYTWGSNVFFGHSQGTCVPTNHSPMLR